MAIESEPILARSLRAVGHELLRTTTKTAYSLPRVGSSPSVQMAYPPRSIKRSLGQELVRRSKVQPRADSRRPRGQTGRQPLLPALGTRTCPASPSPPSSSAASVSPCTPRPASPTAPSTLSSTSWSASRTRLAGGASARATSPQPPARRPALVAGPSATPGEDAERTQPERCHRASIRRRRAKPGRRKQPPHRPGEARRLPAAASGRHRPPFHPRPHHGLVGAEEAFAWAAEVWPSEPEEEDDDAGAAEVST